MINILSFLVWFSSTDNLKAKTLSYLDYTVSPSVFGANTYVLISIWRRKGFCVRGDSLVTYYFRICFNIIIYLLIVVVLKWLLIFSLLDIRCRSTWVNQGLSFFGKIKMMFVGNVICVAITHIHVLLNYYFNSTISHI